MSTTIQVPSSPELIKRIEARIASLKNECEQISREIDEIKAMGFCGVFDVTATAMYSYRVTCIKQTKREIVRLVALRKAYAAGWPVNLDMDFIYLLK